MAKRTIDQAKAAKKDEFYTQLEDINNELRHYREHFRGKTVLCNCDDPRISNFHNKLDILYATIKPISITITLLIPSLFNASYPTSFKYRNNLKTIVSFPLS